MRVGIDRTEFVFERVVMEELLLNVPLRNAAKPTMRISAMTISAETPREIALLSVVFLCMVDKIKLELFDTMQQQGCSEI